MKLKIGNQQRVSLKPKSQSCEKVSDINKPLAGKTTEKKAKNTNYQYQQ